MKKNGFILYQEYEEKLAMLTDEQVGKLLRAVFLHERGAEITIEMDVLTQFAFVWICGDLKRAQAKYEKAVENGKKGGAPKGNSNAKKQPKTTQYNPSKSTESAASLKQPIERKESPSESTENAANPGEPSEPMESEVNLKQPKTTENNLNDNVNDKVNDKVKVNPPEKTTCATKAGSSNIKTKDQRARTWG